MKRGLYGLWRILRGKTEVSWPYVFSYLLWLLVCKKVLDSKTRTVQSSESAIDSKRAVLQSNYYGIYCTAKISFFRTFTG